MSVERITLSTVLMCTVQPLIDLCEAFKRLRVLVITSVSLKKLHYLAIDNALIDNPCLMKLKLINTDLNSEYLSLMEESII